MAFLKHKTAYILEQQAKFNRGEEVDEVEPEEYKWEDFKPGQAELVLPLEEEIKAVGEEFSECSVEELVMHAKEERLNHNYRRARLILDMLINKCGMDKKYKDIKSDSLVSLGYLLLHINDLDRNERMAREKFE